MIDGRENLRLFDAALSRLEGTRSLSDLESAFRSTGETLPFLGAAFSWWSYPPPARLPDFTMSSGICVPDAEPPADLSKDNWAISLPVLQFHTSGDQDPVEVQVAVLGPRRRLGVLRAMLSIGSSEIDANAYDWRGRFLVLAHIVQHHVGLWNGEERPALGRREIQCLKLAAEGLKAKQIASALGIGQQTVQFHLSRAREKLNCSNTVQAVARAAQFGLLPDSVPVVAAEA
ncbi:MAG: helix-turn-helix transcriptional regulator [Beijerinckiaceae bacterium]|nr:helix-turn-helix transcriptional regulator [Beijerinckiaceae bacterium]